MKFKDKLLAQVVVCLCLSTILQNVDISKNYTLDDLKSFAKIAKEYIVLAPNKLEEVVTAANEISYFSYPIDKTSKDTVVNVRAAAGGVVIYSGIDKKLGACIRIQHDQKISTYGNLKTIKVITGDRIKKSQIIGTYDKESLEEFYYHLEDNVI